MGAQPCVPAFCPCSTKIHCEKKLKFRNEANDNGQFPLIIAGRGRPAKGKEQEVVKAKKPREDSGIEVSFIHLTTHAFGPFHIIFGSLLFLSLLFPSARLKVEIEELCRTLPTMDIASQVRILSSARGYENVIVIDD